MFHALWALLSMRFEKVWSLYMFTRSGGSFSCHQMDMCNGVRSGITWLSLLLLRCFMPTYGSRSIDRTLIQISFCDTTMIAFCKVLTFATSACSVRLNKAYVLNGPYWLLGIVCIGPCVSPSAARMIRTFVHQARGTCLSIPTKCCYSVFRVSGHCILILLGC